MCSLAVLRWSLCVIVAFSCAVYATPRFSRDFEVHVTITNFRNGVSQLALGQWWVDRAEHKFKFYMDFGNTNQTFFLFRNAGGTILYFFGAEACTYRFLSYWIDDEKVLTGQNCSAWSSQPRNSLSKATIHTQTCSTARGNSPSTLMSTWHLLGQRPLRAVIQDEAHAKTVIDFFNYQSGGGSFDPSVWELPASVDRCKEDRSSLFAATFPDGTGFLPPFLPKI